MYIHKIHYAEKKARWYLVLRASYRQFGRVRNWTLAHLKDWPAEDVAALEAALQAKRKRLGSADEGAADQAIYALLVRHGCQPYMVLCALSPQSARRRKRSASDVPSTLAC